jgi:hypothetical protein
MTDNANVHIEIHKAWYASLALSLASFGFVACAHNTSLQPESLPTTTMHANKKISPLLETAAQQLMQGKSSKEFHSGLVRADDQGRLQVYIYVSSFSPKNLATLSVRGLVNAKPSPSLHLVQGWLRPRDLESMAGLTFVIRITPPRYAYPR